MKRLLCIAVAVAFVAVALGTVASAAPVKPKPHVSNGATHVVGVVKSTSSDKTHKLASFAVKVAGKKNLVSVRVNAATKYYISNKPVNARAVKTGASVNVSLIRPNAYVAAAVRITPSSTTPKVLGGHAPHAK